MIEKEKKVMHNASFFLWHDIKFMLKEIFLKQHDNTEPKDHAICENIECA